MPEASWRELVRGRHALSTTVVVLTTLAPAINTFLTSTVLPSVIAEIGGLALYAWASTAYAVAAIVGSAAAPVFTRRLGTRVDLAIAAALFIAGTSACAAAMTMAMMVGGRAIQGFGGGMMLAAAYGMVRQLFPEGLWPRVLASISGAWGIAALSGPFVGGLFAQHGLWRVGFGTMVPLVALAAAMSWRLLRPGAGRPEVARGVPMGRLLLICAAVLCVGSVANAASVASRGALVAGAAGAIALTLRIDRAAALRLFPTEMLSLRHTLGRAFWMIFLLAMAGSPIGVFMPLLVQILHGIPPAVSGYFYAGTSLSWTCAALLFARLTGDQVRAAIVVGPLVMASGLTGLYSTIGPGPVVAIAASAIVVGAGMGLCWAHVANIMMAAARADEGEVTASLIPSTQLFATAFGAAVCGVVANAAGLGSGASKPVAALTGAALYGGFAFAPLTAGIIASRLRPRT
jgi:Major Facilitator Superfamily